jgi:MerR family transcriptional regulator, light-induced transcriptional regulator
MLGVSPSTLRAWERRHEFPRPRRTEGNHRVYELQELEALRDALGETGTISAAIELARRGGRPVGSVGRLVAAFDRYDEVAADREMEESLAIRSLERAVDELMLPAVEAAAERPGRKTELDLACRWASGWLRRAASISPPAWRDAGVLLLESRPGPNVDSLHAQALELSVRRSGLRSLLLSADLAAERMHTASTAVRPDAIVLCGHGADDGRAAVEGVLRAPGSARIYSYRWGAPLRPSTPLPPSPFNATEALLHDLV